MSPNELPAVSEINNLEVSTTIGSMEISTTVDISDGFAQVLDLSFYDGIKGVDFFDGDYSYIPDKDEQVIECSMKTMKENVLISGIKTFQVSNLSGGTTFYIDKEITINGK